MNILLLLHILTIAEQKSINRAAAVLHLSQPHLSQSLHALEGELGYSLFIRSHNGVLPTEKGRLFLQHARKIISEYKKMKNLATQQAIQLLHVASTNSYIYEQAFLQTLKFYGNPSLLQFRFTNGTIDQIVNDVYQGTAQIGSILRTGEFESSWLNRLKNRHITYHSLLRLPLIITVRKDHPLIRDGQLALDGLHDYPFVDYVGTPVLQTIKEAARYADPSRIIEISSASLRHQIVASTDSFAIGFGLPSSLLDFYGLTAFPLKQSCCMGILYLKENGLTEESSTYVHFIKELIRKKYPEMTV